MGFAGNEVELSERQGDGSTLRDHLMSHWRQSGYAEDKMPEQLRPVEHNESAAYLWEYFCDMSRRRTSNGFSLNPITDEGVEAWARRRRVRLLPFEHRLIDAMEEVFLRIKNRPKEA